MTKERSSSVRRPVDTSLSNSFSSGASSLSSTNYGVKTIRVFKNGDPYHQGAKFVVNRRYIRDLDHLLSVISEKFDLPYGAKRLYTTNGKPIRHLSEIEDKQNFVASSSHFTPHNYGSWTNNPNGQSVQGSFPINPPQSRTSRSQTRNDTAKSPAPKKRSQSGLTITSEKSTKSRASTKSSKAPAPMKVDVSEPKKKKKVLKKKKKPAEIAPPEAETKKDEKKEELPKEKVEKEEVKEKKSEEAGQESPKQKEKEEPKKEEIVVPEEKHDSPRSHQRTPSPDEHQHSDDDEHDDKGERQHTNKTATPTASEHSATDGEGHSDDEEHSDGNEPDEERSPPPSPRKPTPAPNGKLEKHSSTDNDSAASDKDSK
ncbi:hypothetical protein Q1695_013523 [Nippostrongylus brasiliensis]|nr:hypothetical protein Q1695_013523 [Nippostrongylus brasiliensis]